MLKHGEINPLNVFGLRQLDHCPPHFERVYFRCQVTDKIITDWVFENLEGRFWFGTQNLLDSVDRCIAFEVASEATMFNLCLDQFNNYDYLSNL